MSELTAQEPATTFLRNLTKNGCFYSYTYTLKIFLRIDIVYFFKLKKILRVYIRFRYSNLENVDRRPLLADFFKI